jgi:hypothetical protein
MVTLTQEERSGMTVEELKVHQADEELTVFGRNKLGEPAFKRDRDGKPVEQGVGSPGNEGQNHFASIRKYEGEEAYQKAIAEFNIRKKSAAKG